jgi:hypothetical protein
MINLLYKLIISNLCLKNNPILKKSPLAVLTTRKIDNGNCIKYHKKYYLPVDTNDAVYYRKGTSGIVIKAFNNELFFCVNEKVYALELIPSHVSSSKNFDFANYKETLAPWKQASFERYCNKP